MNEVRSDLKILVIQCDDIQPRPTKFYIKCFINTVWTGIVWLRTGSSCEAVPPPPVPQLKSPLCLTITDTPYAVGFLWTSDQPNAEIPAWHYTLTHSQETDIYASGGIRMRNPSMRAATDPRLRPRGRWDRLWMLYVTESSTSLNTCNLLTSCMISSCWKIHLTKDYLCADYLVCGLSVHNCQFLMTNDEGGK
jgi:hypothetical protein